MRRREFIAGVIFAVTAPRVRAQQAGKVYRLAIVSPATPVSEMNETSGN